MTGPAFEWVMVGWGPPERLVLYVHRDGYTGQGRPGGGVYGLTARDTAAVVVACLLGFVRVSRETEEVPKR